jgi:hypothetical protein
MIKTVVGMQGSSDINTVTMKKLLLRIKTIWLGFPYHVKWAVGSAVVAFVIGAIVF